MIVRTTVKSIQDIMRQDVGVDGDAQRISQLCWMFFLKIIDDQDQELELTVDNYRSPIPKYYEQVVDAPDAMARLRRFVLDLAVRGRLVPQDPSDEPASELLWRIAGERTRRTRERKPDRSNRTVGDLALRFLLSRGWTWTSLQAVCDSITDGDHLPPPKAESGVPFLVIGDVRSGVINYSPERYVSRDYYDRLDPTRQPRRGDLLYTLVGSFGIPVEIVDDKAFCVQRHIGILRPSKCVLATYLVRIMGSEFVFRQADTCATGIAQKTVPLSGLRDITIPLPPFAEQHRIVAKIDELMALCDRLEAARAEREAIRDRFTAASFARLNAPDPGTFLDDTRFALDALPALTARADQIKHLRQTILNLAVRGKLVPQDPNDEPASGLLRRIAAGKAEMKRRTGDARIRPAPAPDPAALPMVLPRGWAAQSFENLFLFIDYRGKTPPKTREGVPLITAKNIRMGYLNREPREFISEKTFNSWMTRGFPKVGDLFFTTEAPLANICINEMNEPFALAQRAICLQLFGGIDTKYLMFVVMSDVMQSLIDAHATGMTAKGIRAANLKPLPIPIPPLAEQHRIVAKVSELMEMCDNLEASLVAADETRRRLLEALLVEALASDKERYSTAQDELAA